MEIAMDPCVVDWNNHPIALSKIELSTKPSSAPASPGLSVSTDQCSLPPSGEIERAYDPATVLAAP